MHVTGISDEQLMKIFCKRLHVTISATNCVPWPPRIDQLEEEEEICHSLVQFLSWLKHPNEKPLDFDPKTLSLASIITQYVTGKRMTTSINYGVDLYGHSRNRELVDEFHKAEFIISYADILFLYDAWGLKDVTESIFIPREIAPDIPAICITDNDDFKIEYVDIHALMIH